MKDNKQSRFAFIISVLLHLSLLFIVMLQKKRTELENAKTKEVAQVEWVELYEKPQSEKLEERQIVEQDDQSINDKTPEKDYRLSKNNQDVLKETRAEKTGEFKNRKNLVDGESAPTQTVAEAPPQSESPTEKNEEKPSEPTEVKEFNSGDKIFIAKQQKLDLFKPKLFDNSFDPSKLAPPSAPARSGSEISQNDDYLKDVVASSETLLKTREFVYYSYYNRIKKQLRQHWEPRIKEKIVKIIRQGRRLASVNDKITRLVITLDESGELVRIQVRDASGYNDLDDAAIEAFRSAAPFPNPPDGIVDGSGHIELNWDFVLET